MPDNLPKTAPASLALFAILAGIFANALWASRVGDARLAAWLITVAMIVLLGMAIGKAINGRWDGVLVNNRNRVSLPRVQMCAWTLLILSGLITGASANLALPGSDALEIDIQYELLAAMGIAAVSLAATPAILSLKTRDGSAAATDAALATRPNSNDAKWLDMFRGDEAGDQDMPDLSKIQQFLITLALVGAYAVELGNLLHGLGPGARFAAFPLLGQQAIWLLGISHAGYLGYKAASKPTVPPGPTGVPAPPTANPPAPPPS